MIRCSHNKNCWCMLLQSWWSRDFTAPNQTSLGALPVSYTMVIRSLPRCRGQGMAL